jgi:hypothetical protein
LFLWVPTPHLESAFVVLREWDFDYKTTLTWVKSKLGLGRYFRGCTEHVLFATRGNLPLRQQNLKNWFSAPSGAHSAKPELFYQLVEKACFGPFLELFARQNRPGWFCWGAELEPIHQPTQRTAKQAWAIPFVLATTSRDGEIPPRWFTMTLDNTFTEALAAPYMHWWPGEKFAQRAGDYLDPAEQRTSIASPRVRR